MLKHDAEALVEVCPLAQAFRDIRVHFEPVTHLRKRQVRRIGRTIPPESQRGSTMSFGLGDVIAFEHAKE